MLSLSEVLVSYGLNCRDKNTPLMVRALPDIYEMIISPDNKELSEYTKNLRSVLRYSKERYRSMKTQLPFFSCSLFDPAHRTVHHFKEAYGLVIDLDFHHKVSEDMVYRFKKDPRIVVGYISPSQMGLKLIFYFDQPVKNPSLYTLIYKKFSVSFGQQYHIADSIDPKNSDVSRISFLCHDAHAWLQPDAMPIETENYVQEYVTGEVMDQPEEGGLTPTAYRHILSLLDTKPRPVKQEIPLVREISDIMPEIQEALESYGIQLKNTESIQYGAKIRVIREKDQGELNIYYGRHGYKVVTSPRKGTHHELNEVTRQIVEGVVIRY